MLAGGPTFVSEITNVSEIGYRAQPSAQVTYSISLYRNAHNRLRSFEPVGAGSFIIANKMAGTTTGMETWGSYQAAKNWRLSAGALLLRQRLRLQPDSRDPAGIPAAGNDPAHQWTIRSSLDLTGNTGVDISIRRVGALPSPSVPAYTAVDLRYAWKPRRELELALIAQNLFDRAHPEFGTAATRSEIARGVFVKLSLSF
jgi:iron complex outermembrane receptor protein